MSNLENAEFHDFLLTQFFYISNLDILWKVTPKLINHTIFWKNLKSLFTILFSEITQQDLSGALKCFAQTVTIFFFFFFCHQQKIQKITNFDILKTINLEVNMTNRQMTPFFSSTLWALSVGVFYFSISRPLKFISLGPHFALCSDL